VDGFDGPKAAGPVSLGASFEKKTKVEGGPFSIARALTGALSVDKKSEVSVGADGPTAAEKKSVTAKVDESVTFGASLGKLGVTEGFGSGEEFKVETSKPIGAAGSVDPRDPDGMAVGSKAAFTASIKTSESGSISVGEELGKDVKASLALTDSVTRTSGVTFSAQKVNDHTIRVSEGGVDGVSDAFGGNASLKLGKASVSLGLGSVNAETDQHLQTLEFDLNNPVARQSYLDLVGGRAGLPDADPSKGIRAGSVDSFSVTQDSALSFEAKLGGFGIQAGKIPLGSAGASGVLTRAADGAASLTHSARFGNQSFSVDRKFGADGVEDVSQRRYNFLVTGAGPGESPFFVNAAKAGGNRIANSFQMGTNDFQLTLTQAELDQMPGLAKAIPPRNGDFNFINQVSKLDTKDLNKVFQLFGLRSNVSSGLSELAMAGQKPIPGTMFMRSWDNNGMTIRLR